MTAKQDTPVKKAAGFYVGIAAVVLCLAAAIMYGINFKSMEYKEPIYDSTVWILLSVTAVIAAAMLMVRKLDGFAPVALCIGSGISFLMYVHLIIWPVADTIYGIEPFPHIQEVIICAVLLLLSFIVSEVSLYMRKTKVIETKAETKTA
ncbi:hypothetical protein [Murimonas intestini]|uniref:Uncharacterized protein n=1 Tax=Murimonas intestini TaxID=1337051 RepID=A0AB73SYK3_9FIRM|nr:hypothetical protein [Murimonas intestini]MCR1840332.1 hypothetical protein [Murimonas intestini]MCR1868203.1 hypothetical protein [Murimonas intestini]MCR1885553.1 hypothetical protein [Murimonas intestini]